MSQISLNQLIPDADFWDFVVCTKCFLPYSSDDAFTIPFWLTECGHVVCNNHLNPDQSCACCGASNVQVVALQRQMDAPMSDWFRSIPVALDTIAFAAKFQQEMLAAQIQYYRNRQQQYRNFVERLKQEVGELRKINEAFSSENEQLRQQLGSQSRYNVPDHQEPADFTNPHKKRPIVPSSHQFNRDSDQYRSSSPRSIATPIGPNRITLPIGHDAPGLSAEKQRQADQQRHYMTASRSGAPNRPLSSRQLQEFAFAPTDTSQYKVPPLSKTQAAPKFFQRSNQNNGSNTTNTATGTWLTRQEPQGTNGGRPSAPKFKPALPSVPARNNAVSSGSRAPMQRQAPTMMGPPPTPQRSGTLNKETVGQGANRRFVPSTSGAAGSGRLQQGGNQTARSSIQGSRQRMPFVPGNSK